MDILATLDQKSVHWLFVIFVISYVSKQPYVK